MSSKLRKERIKSKIGKISDTLDVIKENLPEDFETFNESRILRDAIYKEVEYCIEEILDICSLINSDLKLGIPEVEDKILDNLERKKIFSKKAMATAREMKRFRNILVHRYGEIDDEQAF